jgi:hypothetical protein
MAISSNFKTATSSGSLVLSAKKNLKHPHKPILNTVFTAA